MDYMVSYKDKSFCPFWIDCKKAKNCSKPLTGEIRRLAKEAKKPIMQMHDKPGCHSSWID